MVTSQNLKGIIILSAIMAVRSKGNIYLGKNSIASVESYSMEIFPSSIFVVWVHLFNVRMPKLLFKRKIASHRCYCANSDWRGGNIINSEHDNLTFK